MNFLFWSDEGANNADESLPVNRQPRSGAAVLFLPLVSLAANRYLNDCTADSGVFWSP